MAPMPKWQPLYLVAQPGLLEASSSLVPELLPFHSENPHHCPGMRLYYRHPLGVSFPTLGLVLTDVNPKLALLALPALPLFAATSSSAGMVQDQALDLTFPLAETGLQVYSMRSSWPCRCTSQSPTSTKDAQSVAGFLSNFS